MSAAKKPRRGDHGKPRKKGTRRLQLEALEERLTPSSFTPAELQKAYGIDKLIANGNNGSGITVAIIGPKDFAPPSARTGIVNLLPAASQARLSTASWSKAANWLLENFGS